MLQCGSAGAQDISFLWKIAQNYQQSGDHGLEEIQLKKILAIDPAHPGASKRLAEIKQLKKSGQTKGVEGSVLGIQSILEGKTVEVLEEKQFHSEKDEVHHLESILRNDAVSEGQKVQIRERLSKYFFKVGMDAIKKEEIRVAIESLEKSIDYNKKFQLSYYELGFLYFRIRELQRGIENLEQFVKLQPSGILSKTVRETLLNKYMSIARKYYYQQDFKNCRPYLERIIRLNKNSTEAETALVYLMNLYFFQGSKLLTVGDYAAAGKNFYEALRVAKEKPDLDSKLFAKLANDAVVPFIKYAQELFITQKDYSEAYKYFQAVTWLVPGSAQSFLAKEYMKEINRINETADNPVVYFNNFIEEENKRFHLEKRSLKLGKKVSDER
jgi:tetratricopeptide (TPR) repeat protein